jgi:hypothetical protein
VRRLPTMPIDQARLRPHLRERAVLEQRPASVLTDIASSDADVASPGWKMPVGDDLDRLPSVGANVGGVIRGTDPLGALLRAERRRR